jgi:hypothetical protein
VQVGRGPSWQIRLGIPQDLNIRYHRRWSAANRGSAPVAKDQLLGLLQGANEEAWWREVAADSVRDEDDGLPVRRQMDRFAARMAALGPIEPETQQWVNEAQWRYEPRFATEGPQPYEIVSRLTAEYGVEPPPFRLRQEVILIDVPWHLEISPTHHLTSLGLLHDHQAAATWLTAALRPLVC